MCAFEAFFYSVWAYFHTSTSCFHYAACFFFCLCPVYDHIHDNGRCSHIFIGTWCTVFIFGYMNEIPPHPFKAFPSYLLQTWCTWCVSQPPPLTHLALPTLCVSHPMRALCLSQPLLQQAPDWLLFLGIFRRRRGLEYLVLPLFTHIRQKAVTEWMRESQGERWSVASLPCILASHGIPTAVLPLSCSPMDLWTFFFPHLFSSYWSKLPQH